MSRDPPLLEPGRALSEPAGLAAARGPGIRVTLDDARPWRPAHNGPRGLTPDDLVVHQQDVQAVVNALWRGGADGVQVMDQRLDRHERGPVRREHAHPPGPRVLPAVRGHRRRRPSDGCAPRWTDEPGVQLFSDYVEMAGLASDDDRRVVTVPAFDGAVT